MAAYGTDQGFTDYLAEMGYVLPIDAPTPAVLRSRGTAYIDGTYEGLWTGVRSGGVLQELGWARTGATFNCVTPIPDDVIPPAIVNASYRAAWLEASSPGILAGSTSSGRRVKRQRVEGAVEREFFDDGAVTPGSGGGAFVDAEIDGAMSAFICGEQESGAFLFTIGNGRCC